LKVGITLAAEDSAAGKTIFIHKAFAICVVGTSAGRHWLNIFGTYLCGQIHQFRRRNKQTVVEPLVGGRLSEITTLAARLAQPGQIASFTDLQIQPVVNFSYSFEELIVCFAFFHHCLAFLILSICSKL
jgi:hypothetical protein